MARRRRKVSKQTQIRRLQKKADQAVSLYVRTLGNIVFGGKCPFCGRGPKIPVKPCKRNRFATEGPAIECVQHIIRRKHKSLRWDLRNLVPSCHADNWQEYRNPDKYRAWFIRNRGLHLYLKLVDESEKKFEPSVEYLENLVELFTERLTELKNAYGQKEV